MNVDATGRPVWWRTDEIARLREAYARGGPHEAARTLGRTYGAVAAKASALGLRAPVAPALWKRVESSRAIDRALREHYQAGNMSELQLSTARSRAWLHRRARELGLERKVAARRDWCARELALLEEHAALPHREIRQVLRKAGFHRSVNSIKLKLWKLELHRVDKERMSVVDIGRIFGISQERVLYLIRQGYLHAKRQNPDCERSPWAVSEFAVRRFCREHPLRVPLKTADAPALLAILMVGDRGW